MNWQAGNPARQPLFVYGTLRRASGHPMSRALAHNARRLGPGAIRGSMTYLGPYPAVVEDEQAGWIMGDVFEVMGGRHFWRVLDIYEGCHEVNPGYERRRIPVRLDAAGRGVWIDAWCYLLSPQLGTCG
ncbi:gamma-glutamylcyclotransferase family protein [Dichotomicrobium thermohalophilum]|uniref:Gamma-glutamylcyclotransferase (GGCT)/AIG2-like uncharacterized protein YtfP n=1 Tax=Dichotomicrobium thermohalophilum TaxID=933063 RepID=A0A397Q0B6_9HYPH|nr:gamma-glutamylcyclotransferase family protein [Dichotomicrobium thermohalophilum]RIA54960.1 gamma-glutamylcyclotransferase (GGCT)/AIG2-like uncharacterized protein YtfP [Dichotomicrobium thermohalophilum]